MLAPRPRPLQLLSWVTLFILLVIVYRSPQYVKHPEDLPRPSRPPPQDPQPGNQKPLKPYKPPVISEETLRKVEAPTNSTLGFGAIVVVSKADSSRRDSLLQAANVTELDFVIPDQPKWTDQDVKKFQNGPDTKIGHGSVMAWLGHNHALQWFLDSGLETALFLEDDVDWDIHLRTLQVPLAAGAARQLLGKSSADANNDGEYWGSTDAWDLLYIGHCGDYFGPVPPKKGPPIQVPSNLTSIPHTTFADPSMPNREDLHPFTADMLSNLKLAEHTRAIHRSRFPLCTFAYAVTRDAARRLVTELAPPREAAPDAVEHPRAFDVAVLHACRNGYDLETKKDRPEGLKCYSVNPELFHHMPGSSTIADVEKSRGNKVGLPPVDAKGAKQVEYRDETSNIGCGFFSGDFRFWDLDRLAWLRENVGRKGQCLKNGQNIQHP